MAYPRKRVRKNLGALMQGIPGIRHVYLARRWPREPGRLPCLSIYVAGEDLSSVPGTGRPGTNMRERLGTARIVVVLPDTGLPDEDAEDALDDTLEEIERRLASNPHLAGEDGIPFASLADPDRLDTGFDGQGAQGCLIGAIGLTWKVHHRAGRPDLTLPATHRLARGETP